MEKVKCACGKTMSKYYFNSTIRRKQCPNCELKNKLSGDDKAVKKGLERKAKKKKTPRQRAMDRADQWFSRYIRLKHSFENGRDVICICYTCGKPKHILSIENGHFQRRGYKTVRYHINNARPQCTKCNKWHSGMPEQFEIRLRKDIGDEQVDAIKALAQELGLDDEQFYREQATKYRKLFNGLLKEKDIQSPWKKNY